jgi:hypothetical protein
MSSITSPASTSSDHASDTASSRRKSRVSAEHTLNRVRENQRRHRARQRDRVACLEEKLAETEQELVDARAEIALLKAQQDVTSILCRSTELNTLPDNTLPCNAHDTDAEEPNLDAMPFTYPDLSFDLSPAFLIDIATLSTPDPNILSLPPPPPSSLPGPPPCCSDTPSNLPSLPEDPECSTCKTKPLPDPSESTTLCAQAFVLISQQNFRNLDPGTIRMWLAQGLRRARREGEGCRVENGALWRLLDYISGI